MSQGNFNPSTYTPIIKVQKGCGAKKYRFKKILGPKIVGTKTLGKMIWLKKIEVKNIFLDLPLTFCQNPIYNSPRNLSFRFG